MGTATGPVKLRARFVPEDIGIRWYDGNTQVNVSSSSNTCEYDTGINLPTTPTRTGYTFNGWKVVPQYDMSTLNAVPNATYSWAKDSNTCRYCDNANNECVRSSEVCNNTEFKDLNTGDWKVTFSYGTIYGQSRCSVTYSGQLISDSIDETTGGIYCWCRITGIIPSNQNTRYAPKQSVWILNKRVSGNIGSDCQHQECASGCAIVIKGVIGYRQRAFGQSN